ncbi:hypothetical protein ACGFZP_03255 [Kitasatospora sp. NPDC048239]|uniref:hypothetical protein n=1 Tax=Kitasatospora sp. NPDC048239 TaxID=3364046 RepID=UPI0037233395
MFPVQLTLLDVSARPPGEANAAAVQDALRGCAGPGDGLEHVRARAMPEGVGLVLYVRAPDRAAAERRAHALLDRALAAGPAGRFAPALPLPPRRPGADGALGTARAFC